MLGYWGIVAMMVKNGILREKQFLEPAISGEVFFVLAKIRAFLPELRERTKNPDMLRNV